LRLGIIFRIAWFLGVAVVIVGSLLPGDSTPIAALDKLDISDKVQHFAAYMVLAFVPALHERWRVVAILAATRVGLGILLEFGQMLSPSRDFEIGDMVADAAGVCAGIAAGWSLRRRVGRYLRR
jgi:VanZ family protein